MGIFQTCVSIFGFSEQGFWTPAPPSPNTTLLKTCPSYKAPNTLKFYRAEIRVGGTNIPVLRPWPPFVSDKFSPSRKGTSAEGLFAFLNSNSNCLRSGQALAQALPHQGCIFLQMRTGFQVERYSTIQVLWKDIDVLYTRREHTPKAPEVFVYCCFTIYIPNKNILPHFTCIYC